MFRIFKTQSSSTFDEHHGQNDGEYGFHNFSWALHSFFWPLSDDKLFCNDSVCTERFSSEFVWISVSCALFELQLELENHLLHVVNTGCKWHQLRNAKLLAHKFDQPSKGLGTIEFQCRGDMSLEKAMRLEDKTLIRPCNHPWNSKSSYKIFTTKFVLKQAVLIRLIRIYIACCEGVLKYVF